MLSAFGGENLTATQLGQHGTDLVILVRPRHGRNVRDADVYDNATRRPDIRSGKAPHPLVPSLPGAAGAGAASGRTCAVPGVTLNRGSELPFPSPARGPPSDVGVGQERQHRGGEGVVVISRDHVPGRRYVHMP